VTYILYIYINNIRCITQYNGTEWNNFILLKYEIPCLNILYIEIKIYFLSILHISLQIQYKLNLKIREDRNHYRHISSVHKTYLYITYSPALPLQLVTNPNCASSHSHIFLVVAFLQTKRHVTRKRQCLYASCCHHLILWSTMMQHCFYNIRYISNWNFVASARMYVILNVNAFGAELTRGWHISFTYISTIYDALHNIMELNETILFCWNTKFHS